MDDLYICPKAHELLWLELQSSGPLGSCKHLDAPSLGF